MKLLTALPVVAAAAVPLLAAEEVAAAAAPPPPPQQQEQQQQQAAVPPSQPQQREAAESGNKRVGAAAPPYLNTDLLHAPGAHVLLHRPGDRHDRPPSSPSSPSSPSLPAASKEVVVEESENGGPVHRVPLAQAFAGDFFPLPYVHPLAVPTFAYLPPHAHLVHPHHLVHAPSFASELNHMLKGMSLLQAPTFSFDSDDEDDDEEDEDDDDSFFAHGHHGHAHGGGFFGGADDFAGFGHFPGFGHMSAGFGGFHMPAMHFPAMHFPHTMHGAHGFSTGHVHEAVEEYSNVNGHKSGFVHESGAKERNGRVVHAFDHHADIDDANDRTRAERQVMNAARRSLKHERS